MQMHSQLVLSACTVMGLLQGSGVWDGVLYLCSHRSLGWLLGQFSIYSGGWREGVGRERGRLTSAKEDTWLAKSAGGLWSLCWQLIFSCKNCHICL